MKIRINVAMEESGLGHTDWTDVCWVPVFWFLQHVTNATWPPSLSQERAEEFCITTCSSSLPTTPRKHHRAAEIPVNLKFTFNSKNVPLTKKENSIMLMNNELPFVENGLLHAKQNDRETRHYGGLEHRLQCKETLDSTTTLLFI